MKEDAGHASERRWHRGLRARLAMLLALALLPIGLIAINQTNLLSSQARENAELALLALTEKAASQERQVIQRGIGIADAIAALALRLSQDTENCQTYLKALVDSYPRFSFLAIVPKDGRITCASDGNPHDVSQSEGFLDHIGDTSATISVNSNAPISGTSVVVMRQPFLEKDAIAGYALVSIPHANLASTVADRPTEALQEIITFDADGEVLTTTGDFETVADRLPSSQILGEFGSEATRAFIDTDRSGRRKVFAVVPIEQRRIYTMGVWEPDSPYTSILKARVPPVLFPGLMWLISLGVALFAVHTLVIRHVNRLGREMARFASRRELPSFAGAAELPSELQALETRFASMADAILRDEADLENALREKNVLIREVHHRVKNNLQLISSIINMQIRKADHDETREGLRRIQDRVLSLATIHRDLYQTSIGGRVDVGALIEEIVGHAADVGNDKGDGVEVTTDIERIMLYPDQAVPLSLLASEAATNAMKYAGTDDGTRTRIDVELKKTSDTTVRFVFANSMGDVDDSDGTGLGTQLINAFSIQLGATTDVQQTDDRYVLTVSFDIAAFSEESDTA